MFKKVILAMIFSMLIPVYAYADCKSDAVQLANQIIQTPGSVICFKGQSYQHILASLDSSSATLENDICTADCVSYTNAYPVDYACQWTQYQLTDITCTRDSSAKHAKHAATPK